jgi:sugar phosphate isomerase/epimerase
MNGPTPALDPVFFRRESPRPESLPALEHLFEEAAKASLDLVVVAADRSQDKVKARAKRRHDLKAALRTFQLLLKALQGGYRFDGDDAAAKIEAVSRAYQVLEKECLTLDKILVTDPTP